jgi:3-polyprenyl-4-hydroxybenzoate decarboxylase
LSLTKFLLVTDQHIDLADFPALFEAVLERFDPRQDLYIFHNTSHDTLDYTGHRLNHGSKAVLLGTGSPVRELPTSYTAGAIPEIYDIAVYCAGCLVVSGASYEQEADLAQRIVSSSQDQLKHWPIIVLADDTEIAKDQTAFLWTVFTRFNPANDMFAVTNVRNHHVHYDLPIMIDARMKPGYPDELVPREDIVEMVTSRWKQYFS